MRTSARSPAGVEAVIEHLPFGAEFDAIVGRVALMYRREPVRDLQALVRCLRPGGLVVFQEMDLSAGRTIPPAPVIDRVKEWILSAFDRAGIELEMGPKLHSAFKTAGLSSPQLRVDGFMGGSASISPALVTNLARILLP